MKLTEVESKRTFTLTIDEDDLQLLMTAMSHIPESNETFRMDIHDAMYVFRDVCFKNDIRPIARTVAVEEIA